MVCMVFDVLFGFQRSDFCSSDLFPKIKRKEIKWVSQKIEDIEKKYKKLKTQQDKISYLSFQ